MMRTAHHLYRGLSLCLLFGKVLGFQPKKLPSGIAARGQNPSPSLFVYRKEEEEDQWVVSHDELDHDYHLVDDQAHKGTHNIHEAVRQCEDTGDTFGEPVMVKTSKNVAALQREVDNTNLVKEQVEEDVVVDILDHNLPENNDEDGKHAVIVMEKGAQDSLSYLNENYDAQTWAGMDTDVEEGNSSSSNSVASQMVYDIANSIKAIHAAGLVWTDAKLKNFVVMEGENNGDENTLSPTVKAIDLESCTRPGEHPIKFTPSTCPPEFAPVLKAHIQRPSQIPRFATEPSFDVWSLGMIAFLLVTKMPYFPKSNVNFEYLTNCLAALKQDDIDNDPRLKQMKRSHGSDSNDDTVIDIDPLARDFIISCLRVDPNERPTIERLMEHPFIAGNQRDEEEGRHAGASNGMSAYEQQLASHNNQ